MRPLPLMAAGLLAATLLTSPTAYAAAVTCQGQPATIVGTLLAVTTWSAPRDPTSW